MIWKESAKFKRLDVLLSLVYILNNNLHIFLRINISSNLNFECASNTTSNATDALTQRKSYIRTHSIKTAKLFS